MDLMDDSLADLTPLEQRRMRLRAYADRVLKAVEALPMPKTALEGERSLRAITACDRMLIQIYTKVGRQQQIQQDFMPRMARPVLHATSGQSFEPPSPASSPLREDDVESVPFVYAYDDDEIDEGPEEPLSPSPRPRSIWKKRPMRSLRNISRRALRKKVRRGRRNPPPLQRGGGVAA